MPNTCCMLHPRLFPLTLGAPRQSCTWKLIHPPSGSKPDLSLRRTEHNNLIIISLSGFLGFFFSDLFSQYHQECHAKDTDSSGLNPKTNSYGSCPHSTPSVYPGHCSRCPALVLKTQLCLFPL